MTCVAIRHHISFYTPILKRKQRKHAAGVPDVPVPVGAVPGLHGGVWGEDGCHRLGTAVPHPGEGPVCSHKSVT